MQIIAYTYEADIHCPACAMKRFGYSPAAIASAIRLPIAAVEFDTNGLPVNQEDSEGNGIHPIFTTDEQSEPLYCGDCHKEIN